MHLSHLFIFLLTIIILYIFINPYDRYWPIFWFYIVVEYVNMDVCHDWLVLPFVHSYS